MTGFEGFNDKVGFIWSVADLLRGDVRQHEYGQFILPFVVLRRLDCVLDPTKDKVIERAKSLEGKIGNVDPILERVSGAPFYNTSPLTFTALLNDDKNIRANLTSYIAGFSSGAADVLDKYRFSERIATLDKAGLLYQVVAKFADIDLHPGGVPNHAMGYIFEELLRRFSEMQNETAGEHFTPREVIKAMVHILLAEDEKALSGPAPVRTMYDPACGTGGMLSSGQDYLAELNPEAHLEVYGQELNPETWAICRSDMLIKGENPENIVLGNSLSADGHADQRFDYMLANPPFGVDWKKYAEPLVAEAENEGYDGRFGAGLPRSSDGSFLFLQHMISKMKPVHQDPITGEKTGGTRLAIVFSGSPLFSGAAGSGESNIRRWIIESDWLEAVVALPDQLFYNTGINTYFWVVTNRKRPERTGKVALIDARRMASKMRKSLGNKRNYLTDDAVDELTRLYSDAPDLAEDDARVKILPNEALGYQRITVEQPLRRRWEVTNAAAQAVLGSKAWTKWPSASPGALLAMRGRIFETEAALIRAAKAAFNSPHIHVNDKPMAHLTIAEQQYDDWLLLIGTDGVRYDVGRDPDTSEWMATANGDWEDIVLSGLADQGQALTALNQRVHDSKPCVDPRCAWMIIIACPPDIEPQVPVVHLPPQGAGTVPPGVLKELVKAAAIPDPEASVITDRKGHALPDPDLRDAENAPLGEDADEYLVREVHPYAPKAWIDHAKTKIGYEIPLTRHFYVYKPPRPVADLDAEIAMREARISELLGRLR